MLVEELLEAYKELSSYVFGHANYLCPLNPRYDNRRLKKVIQKLLKCCTLPEELLIRDLPKKVVLTTVSLKTNSRSHLWQMEFIQNITSSGGRGLVIDGLVQATAAPAHFTTACNYVNGGMGMNDPSLGGLMFAYGPEFSLRDFMLLSIGTGYFPHFVEHGEAWGRSNGA